MKAAEPIEEQAIYEMAHQEFQEWDEIDGHFTTEEMPLRDVFAVGYLKAYQHLRDENAVLRRQRNELRNSISKHHGLNQADTMYAIEVLDRQLQSETQRGSDER